MGVADELVGRRLRGERRGVEWEVYEKISLGKGHTPGAFSVAYKCRDPQGTEAFLKASDLSKVLGADPNDIVGNILKATTAHDFEKQILEYCSGNAMDRVVTAIDAGSSREVFNNEIDVLFFLIFELAECDLRKRIEKQAELNLLWIVSSIHDFAVAVSQLHRGSVYHNDLKPANALIFGDAGNKIADLGRATTPHFAVAHDREQCAGDRRFAPPEQLYPNPVLQERYDRFELYRAGDLYNLGGLAYYLITGRGITVEIVSRLRDELRPAFFGGGWADSVEGVLPYWQNEFSSLLREANDHIEPNWSVAKRREYARLLAMIKSLCEPDMTVRGHAKQIGSQNQFDLQRYITELDYQQKQLIIESSLAK